MLAPRRLIPLLALSALLGGTGLAAAQKGVRTVELSGPAKCANCGVRLQELGMIGSVVVGSGRLEVNANAYDKTRKLVYARGASRTEINAYSLDGKLQFTVGVHERRVPAGARDFTFTVGPGDSLWVLDPSQQRVIVIAPGTATVGRAFRVKTRVDRILPLKDGSFVGVAVRVEDAPAGQPVHLFSPDGRMLNAIGTPMKMLGVRPAVTLARKNGGVWIARPESYTLEQWGFDGKQIASVHRTVPWFTPDAVAKARKEHRTPPTIVDVSEDDSGVLWVAALKPDPTFRPKASKTPDALYVLEELNIPAQRIEFADEVSAPLYRLSGDYFVEPGVRDRVAAWRVVKVSTVKR
jgi:hypothetical protein